MKIAYLDRDGTIIKDYPDCDWKYKTEPEFLDGSIEALREILSKGYEIIIVTNQYLIGEELITFAQYNNFTTKFLKVLNGKNIKILDIFYCPHARKDSCSCIKPKTGMIDMSIKKYKEINLDQSFIAGDSECDLELGNKLKIKTFGIKTKDSSFDHIRVDNLLDIVKFI